MRTQLILLILLGQAIVGGETAVAMSNGDPAHLSDMGGEHSEHIPAMLDMMTPHQRHEGPHMKWTARRPITSDDAKRAEEIVATLREALRPYQDYRVALDQGFVLRHPGRKTKHYHFGNAERRREARWHFDPGKPTALLYRKSGQGYELEGAMYTAPREMTEEELNHRIPLSVVQWHAHVNLCLATDGSGRRLDHGSGRRGIIATEAECQGAGGRFMLQAGGWMIHVYPFESTSEKIWTH